MILSTESVVETLGKTWTPEAVGMMLTRLGIPLVVGLAVFLSLVYLAGLYLKALKAKWEKR